MADEELILPKKSSSSAPKMADKAGSVMTSVEGCIDLSASTTGITANNSSLSQNRSLIFNRPLPYEIDAIVPADIAEILNKPAPTLMWRGTDVSGAEELVTGLEANNLLDVGTPVKESKTPVLRNALVTKFDSDTDAMVTQSNTVADSTTNTITIMWIGSLNALSVDYENIVQKRDLSAPNYGWDITTWGGGGTDGVLAFVVITPTGSISKDIIIEHSTSLPQVVLATRSITDDVCSIWSRHGSSEGAASAVSGTLTNTAILSIGDGSIAAKAARMSTGLLMIWIGSDGDGFTEEDRAKVEFALGFE